jgi:phosphoribosylanthranilate isomerase
MFRIKICGITSVEDALMTAQAGADAIGLNFYARSPRCVAIETAERIVQAMPAGVVKVGLFVDTPAAEVCRLFDDLHLDLIQLHGNQPPEFLAQLGDRPAMKAFRVGSESFPRIAEYLACCQSLKAVPKLVLLDALVEGKLGGTGRVADWNVARAYHTITGAPPLVLAGGLTPDNVAEAIRQVHPVAVDVASGVESQPGRKDAAAVAAFVQAARDALLDALEK